MTNSTDKATKTPKAKGPVRIEAIVPTFLVVLLLGLYGHFFFDNHLRKGIQWTASYIHGAQVDLRQLKLSLVGGYIELRGLQVTDKDQPERNLLAIEKMRFEILWDALLRLKFVVNEASVEQVSALSPRKKPGWVRPPAEMAKGQSPIEQLEAGVITQVQEQNEGNILGDLAQMAGGISEKDILSGIKDQLQAEKQIAQVKTLVAEKEAQWKERLESLPDKQDFEKIASEAKKLRFDTKDPKSFASDLKEMNRLLKEADSKVDSLKEATRSAGQDFALLSRETSSIDDLIKKDIADIEKRLNIPKMDGASFSKALFMSLVGGKLVGFQKYLSLAKEYMPPPKTDEEKAAAAAAKIVPRQRGEGINYHYPVTKGYPAFWLKTIRVSSTASPGGFSGNLDGEIKNVTSNQALIGQPTTATLKGDFPEQNIKGLLALATFDHRNSPATQEIQAQIGSYPISNFQLQKSSDVSLTLAKASGRMALQTKFSGQSLDVQLSNSFLSPEFSTEAKSGVVQEVLDSVLPTLSTVNVESRIQGTWSKFNIDVDSNLGQELGKGFSAYFKQKTEALRAQIRQQVEGRIGSEKQKLNAELEQLKGRLDSALKSREADLAKAKSEIEGASSKSTNVKEKAKDELKQKGRELLRKLRK